MTELTQRISEMRRPGLLMRAARAGLVDYDRGRDLPRLLRQIEPPSPTAAVDFLLTAEARAEEARVSGGAAYSVSRHIDLLIALLSEFALVRRLSLV